MKVTIYLLQSSKNCFTIYKISYKLSQQFITEAGNVIKSYALTALKSNPKLNENLKYF